eukprot:jgi/Mesen1/3051/ME000018S02362
MTIFPKVDLFRLKGGGVYAAFLLIVAISTGLCLSWPKCSIIDTSSIDHLSPNTERDIQVASHTKVFLPDFLPGGRKTSMHIRVGELPEYQLRGVQQLMSFLKGHSSSSELKDMTLLENGCDVTGRVGNVLSQAVKMYVGVNCPHEKHDIDHLQFTAPNAMYISTNCRELPFANGTFDIVFSDNVLEHAQWVKLFIHETYRVLKKGGLAFIAWDPVWTGPFGHHVHEDMVHRRASRINLTSMYVNNGSFIPPWGHLLYKRDELYHLLLQKQGMGSAELISGILDFVYDGKNINRVPYSVIDNALSSLPWESLPPSNGCQSHTRSWSSRDGVLQKVHPEVTPDQLLRLRKLYPDEKDFDKGPCIFAARKRG